MNHWREEYELKERSQEIFSKIPSLEYRHLVLGILDELAGKKGASVQQLVFTKGHEVDISIRTQINDLEPPIMVEIIHRQSRVDFARTIPYWVSTAKKIGYSSILIVVPYILSSSFFEELHGIQRTAGIAIEVWDFNKLRQVSRGTKYHSVISDGTYNIANLVDLELRIAVDSSKKKEWIERTRERLEYLKREYKRRKITLFLGAGTTYDAKIPLWTDLIVQLVVKVIDETGGSNLSEDIKKKLAKYILEEELDWQLIGGHYVKTALTDDFNSTVSQILYRNIHRGHGGSSSLLEVLADFCIIPKRKKSKKTKRPKKPRKAIPALITYNFDDLLENILDEKGLPYKIIRAPPDIPEPDELPIYHVHGCIPIETRPGFSIGSEFFVLAEEDYQILYQKPTYWANTAQLHYLRETTCLMVGLSLKDPNLRRLLWTVSVESSKPRQFMLAKRVSKNEVAEKVGAIPFEISKYLDLHHELQESAFSKIGVNIVWYDDHLKLPDYINYIKGSEDAPPI